MTDPHPLTLMYRGPLASCNYACAYCPFALQRPRRSVLQADREALGRFMAWVAGLDREVQVFFTPWGEALGHRHYGEALATLSHMGHVRRAGIQTNGSGPLGFLRAAVPSRLALWMSWHPTQVTADRFLARVERAHEAGVQLSVGVVAIPGQEDVYAALRTRLPPAAAFWVNALKPGGRYTETQRDRLRALDPEFDLELVAHPSRGRACGAGETALTVDGDGTVRRCHFVDRPLGNIHVDPLEQMLAPRLCPRSRCDCYLGYQSLTHLGLAERHGDRAPMRLLRSPA